MKSARSASRNSSHGQGEANRAVRARSARGTIVAPQTNIVPISTERDAAEQFSALVVDFSAGQLASAARRSKETAKRWKSARAFPNGVSLIHMACSLPTVNMWLKSQIDAGDRAAQSGSADGVWEAVEMVAQNPGPEGDMARAMVRARGKS